MPLAPNPNPNTTPYTFPESNPNSPPNSNPNSNPDFDEDAWAAPTFRFLERMAFRPHGKTLLLAVSGGADSVAMLRFFAGPARRRFECVLHMAHVNHALRPEADEEETFVTELGVRLGVQVHTTRLDPASRRPRESLEMWGRRHRYAWFDTLKRDLKCDYTLTAHHADDQAETLLMRIRRGTGARGLQGILFRGEGALIRPFLDRRRSQLETYLRQSGQPWREDSSNRDLRHTRNFVRHRLLPDLERRQPGATDRLARLALEMQVLWPKIESLERRMPFDAVEPGVGESKRSLLPWPLLEEAIEKGWNGSLAIWLEELVHRSGAIEAHCRISEGVLRQFLRQWHSGSRCPPNSISTEEPGDNGARAYLPGTFPPNRPRPFRLSLPGGVFLYSTPEGLSAKMHSAPSVTTKSQAAASPPGFEPLELLLPEVGGEARISWFQGSKRYTLQVWKKAASMDPSCLDAGRFPSSSSSHALFDAIGFSSTLWVRPRKNGDRFSPYGISSLNRKLKVFLNEKKVPVEERNSLPLVTSGDLICWVPGYGLSDFFKITPSSHTILEMVIECQNP